jgi:cobalt-zinc-cadmium efflux system membrane fusion protein
MRIYLYLVPILLTAYMGACDRQPAAPAAANPDVSKEAAVPAAATGPVAAAVETFEESDPVKLTSEAVKHFGIRMETLSPQRLSNTFMAPAKIALNQEAIAHVGAPVSGRVVEAKIRVGDTVAKDAPLLVLDSPEFGEAQSDLLQKRTAETVATSAMEISRSGYERGKKLLEESQGIALTEVQKREAEFKAAEGTLLSAKAAVTAAENKLKLLGLTEEAIAKLDKTGINARYVVRSPLGGRVLERSIALGELVRPERDALLVVADMSTLWVLADVPEAHVKDVALDAKVRITLPAAEGKVIEGVIAYIAPRLDEATRTMSVRIVIPADGTAVVPGMFAQAAIIAPAKEPPVLAIPEGALQMIEGKPNVFVPVKGVENAFVARRVKLGLQVGQQFPVLGGLKAGEPFVAAGSFILKAELGKGGVQEE